MKCRSKRDGELLPLTEDELCDANGGMLETHTFRTPTGCLSVGETILLFANGKYVSLPQVSFTPGGTCQ